MEIMNLRYRNNAWRPIGEKSKIANNPIANENLTITSWNLTKIWLHVQDDISNYIGLHKISDTSYQLYNMGPTSSGFVSITDDDIVKAYSGDVDVVFLKRFMIVVYEGGMDRFLYKDDEYVLINYPAIPKLTLKATGTTRYITEAGVGDINTDPTIKESMLSRYRKKILEVNKDDGSLTGGIMYRVAFKLFDGNYVLHTTPTYINLGLEMGVTSDLRSIAFYTSKLQASFSKEDYTSIDKDIFTHVSIFACKNHELYQVDEDGFPDDFWEGRAGNPLGTIDPIIQFESFYEDINADFKEMADSDGWYEIAEIDISEIQETTDASPYLVKNIDTKQFHTDYATRKLLPVDQLSHHDLSGNIIINYNSRLVLSALSYIFGSYIPLTDYYDAGAPIAGYGYGFDSERHTYLLYTLKTDQGEVKQLTEYGNLNFYIKSGEPGTKKFFYLPRIIGYPDIRASQVEVLSKDGESYYNVGSFALKKATLGNYTYYHTETFDVDPEPLPDSDTNYSWPVRSSSFTAEEQVNINLYLNDNANIVSDSNRVQLSEVNNPFFFPAKNSYQVGTGEIRGIAANTEPLSSGQFGEFPLQVFTSKGVWAMLQGTGDVVFSNVVPSSSHVMKAGSSLVSTGDAVVFQNEKNWIFALSGREVQQLSMPLDNPQDVDFHSNLNFQYFLNYISIASFGTIIDDSPFSVYIEGALIGFDKENNELIVTNSNYGYSYVFSFESGFWYKISESYRVLVNNYPFLEGLNSRGLIRLSTETSNNKVQTLFVSREQSLDFNEVWKRLDRSLVRVHAETQSSKYFGFYIFGSDDLFNWQLTSGNDRKTGKIKDVRSGRSHKKWKYYIFVICAEVSTDSILTFIDTQFALKVNAKLR